MPHLICFAANVLSHASPALCTLLPALPMLTVELKNESFWDSVWNGGLIRHWLSAWSMAVWSTGLVLYTDGSRMAGRCVREVNPGKRLWFSLDMHVTVFTQNFVWLYPNAKNCIWRAPTDEHAYEGHSESKFTFIHSFYFVHKIYKVYS
jgi:hypothetical protein